MECVEGWLTSCACGGIFLAALQLAKRKKNKKNKRRRLEENDEVEDACADMYRAAQAQLEQEMKAAGMEGSLPMSFGGGSWEKTSRKRKRSLEAAEIEEEEDEVKEVEGEERKGTEEKGQIDAIEDRPENEEDAGEGKPKTETAIVDKVRVVYDSEGEVAERVVEKVEVVTVVRPEELSIREIKHKNSNGKEAGAGKKKNKYPEHIAKRLSCDTVVDPFAGCGGNVIQLAMTCKHVIAIDIDPEKIRMAKHNAAIYGVADKIEWIVGNSIDILPKVKADAVFLSPPWGGVNYSRKLFSLENMLVKGVTGLDLFAKARCVSKNIAYYLPRGTPTEDLEALTPGEPVEREKIFLDKQLKVVTAYYGDLVAPQKDADDTASPSEEVDPLT
ncbi:unnamed protein product [Phytophthora lilii]|uniref:Trimethylguanosine synthase n=1 Tax=Phytophthora lilii TaxID=2077276 RepID=A0A9W6WQU6_9STRA|nr:unnamed protein product [Phytophthora lilii]